MTREIDNKASIWNLVFKKRSRSEELSADHLHSGANLARGKLEDIFKELVKKQELAHLAQEVISPMLKEVDHIQSTLEIKVTSKGITKYLEWTEKASRWVEIYTESGSEEALLEHVIENSHYRIERDIKLITKYMEAHKLDPVSRAELDPIIQSLSSLREKPKDLSLKKVKEWRSHFNATRAKTVDAALQRIEELHNP